MSEKLEALLQAVIDAETDTSYHYASESLAEAAPQILALIKARTPAPEGEAWRTVPVEPTEAMIEAAQRATPTTYLFDGDRHNIWSAMLAASPVVPAPEGEVVAWQRRMRNVKAAAYHPWSQWSSWKECTEAQRDESLATGMVFGFPDLRTEVRPLYASPIVPAPEGKASLWGCADGNGVNQPSMRSG